MATSSLSSRAIIGRFYSKLEQGATGWADKLAFPVSSDQASEDYKWLGMSPVMREWVGGRIAKGLRDNGYAIKNLPFEATMEVLVDDLRRDKTGQILVRVDDMAARANVHWARLISALVLGGAAATCYDGQYFFDTDHAEGGSGTLSNKISVDISAIPAVSHGSTTAPSIAEFASCILKAIETMYGFKDDQGEPYNEAAKDFMVMVPTPLWGIAASAIKNPVIDQGNTNVLVNLDGQNISLVSNPRLTWTDTFAVFRTDGIVKPFIKQEEVPVQVSAIAEGSTLEINERKHQYGLYASGNAGYGMWQHAVQVTMV